MAKAHNKLFSRADVIAELYELRNEHIHWKSTHIQAFGAQHGQSAANSGSIKPCGECHVCKVYDGIIDGVERAIRRFGGRPR